MVTKHISQKPVVGEKAALLKQDVAMADPYELLGYTVPETTRGSTIGERAVWESRVFELLKDIHRHVAREEPSIPVEEPSPLAVLRKRVEDKASEVGDDAVPDAGARLDSCVEAANFVKTLRIRSGLTQKQLADKSGVQQATISNIERIRVKDGPRVSTLGALAHACGYDFRLKIQE